MLLSAQSLEHITKQKKIFSFLVFCPLPYRFIMLVLEVIFDSAISVTGQKLALILTRGLMLNMTVISRQLQASSYPLIPWLTQRLTRTVPKSSKQLCEILTPMRKEQPANGVVTLAGMTN